MSAGRALVTALAWPRRAVSTAVPLARNRLMRLPKAQLVERVKGLGLQESGTKADLVVRIMGSSGTAAPAPAALGEDEIGALKVSELKARLQALGGKTAGSKSELQVLPCSCCAYCARTGCSVGRTDTRACRPGCARTSFWPRMRRRPARLRRLRPTRRHSVLSGRRRQIDRQRRRADVSARTHGRASAPLRAARHRLLTRKRG